MYCCGRPNCLHSTLDEALAHFERCDPGEQLKPIIPAFPHHVGPPGSPIGLANLGMHLDILAEIAPEYDPLDFVTDTASECGRPNPRPALVSQFDTVSPHYALPPDYWPENLFRS